jgi:uncharacterized protein (DUF488 family)
MSAKVFTIGHSNHLFSSFLELIQENNINLVVDVRSSPYSKYSPHFNKKPLQKALEDSNIEYAYFGNKIGGKPRDNKFYHQDKVLYHLLEKDDNYQDGIKDLMDLIKDKNVVLMCSEENPYHCHRHHLISQSLLKNSFIITHIRGNGELETVENDYQARLI